MKGVDRWGRGDGEGGEKSRTITVRGGQTYGKEQRDRERRFYFA